jgi:hypothetical protein
MNMNELSDTNLSLYELSDVNFDNYQEYIMDNADQSEVTICNGDTLLEAAENSYLLEEFLQSSSFVTE